MNWVGGARSRVKQKQEKKKQQEYFERIRFEKNIASRIKESSLQIKPEVSQDLFFLRTLNKPAKSAMSRSIQFIAQQIQDPKDYYLKPVQMEQKKNISKEIKNLPMSPITEDSKLQLNDINECNCETNIKFQDKENITEFMSYYRQNTDVSDSIQKWKFPVKQSETEQEFISNTDMMQGYSNSNVNENYTKEGNRMTFGTSNSKFTDTVELLSPISTDDWESPSRYQHFKKRRYSSGSVKVTDNFKSTINYDSPMSLISMDLQDRSFYSPNETYLEVSTDVTPSTRSKYFHHRQVCCWDPFSQNNILSTRSVNDSQVLVDEPNLQISEVIQSGNLYSHVLKEERESDKEILLPPSNRFKDKSQRTPGNKENHSPCIANDVQENIGFISNDNINLSKEDKENGFKYCKQEIKPLVPLKSINKLNPSFFKSSLQDVRIGQQKFNSEENVNKMEKISLTTDTVKEIFDFENENVFPAAKQESSGQNSCSMNNDKVMDPITEVVDEDKLEKDVNPAITHEGSVLLQRNKKETTTNNKAETIFSKFPEETYANSSEGKNSLDTPDEMSPSSAKFHKSVQTDQELLKISCAVQNVAETTNVSTQVGSSQNSQNSTVFSENTCTTSLTPDDEEDLNNLNIISAVVGILKYLVEAVSFYERDVDTEIETINE